LALPAAAGGEGSQGAVSARTKQAVSGKVKGLVLGFEERVEESIATWMSATSSSFGAEPGCGRGGPLAPEHGAVLLPMPMQAEIRHRRKVLATTTRSSPGSAPRLCESDMGRAAGEAVSQHSSVSHGAAFPPQQPSASLQQQQQQQPSPRPVAISIPGAGSGVEEAAAVEDSPWQQHCRKRSVWATSKHLVAIEIGLVGKAGPVPSPCRGGGATVPTATAPAAATSIASVASIASVFGSAASSAGSSAGGGGGNGGLGGDGGSGGQAPPPPAPRASAPATPCLPPAEMVAAAAAVSSEEEKLEDESREEIQEAEDRGEETWGEQKEGWQQVHYFDIGEDSEEEGDSVSEGEVNRDPEAEKAMTEPEAGDKDQGNNTGTTLSLPSSFVLDTSHSWWHAAEAMQAPSDSDDEEGASPVLLSALDTARLSCSTGLDTARGLLPPLVPPPPAAAAKAAAAASAAAAAGRQEEEEEEEADHPASKVRLGSTGAAEIAAAPATLGIPRRPLALTIHFDACSLGIAGGVLGVAAGTVVGVLIGAGPAIVTLGASLPVGAGAGGVAGLCLGGMAGVACGTLEPLGPLRVSCEILAPGIRVAEEVVTALPPGGGGSCGGGAPHEISLIEERCGCEANREARAAFASAVAGTVVLGSVGGASGTAVGGLIGAGLGVVPAVFTFGLSVPLGAALGSGVGLCVGSVSAGSVGFVTGGWVGRRAAQPLSMLLGSPRGVSEGEEGLAGR